MRASRPRSLSGPVAPYFTGIGPVGASIFGREVQLVWDEQFPYAGDLALATAERLGLGGLVELQRLTDGVEQFTTLVAALVRCGLAGDSDEIIAAAGGRSGRESD